ncbi:MAG: hypothetical protein GY838_05320, partial [bacterium]|nr:hypothetical protein [bacterium]
EGGLTFAAGETAATVSVGILDDLVDEPDETFQLVLSGPVHADLGVAAATATILDDDEVLISIADLEIGEGDAGTTEALFAVELVGTSDRQVEVQYRTVAETAAAGHDFGDAAGTLTFPVGAVAGTIAVPIVGDVILESDETFYVELYEPVNATLVDGQGEGRILDDELCLGPNLLANPSAEEALVGGEIPGWTEVEGEWRQGLIDPLPVDGEAYFAAGAVEVAELRQDVDLMAYAAAIADGSRWFAFEGWVRSIDETPSDLAQIIVEYRDAAGGVLATFDSGDVASVFDWYRVEDLRMAPAGTRLLRVRLRADRLTGTDADVYFDALSVRSLRIPVVAVNDAAVAEGDAGITPAVFDVALTCLTAEEVSVGYATVDLSATAGDDYEAKVDETLLVPAGTQAATIAVSVFGDADQEPDESFVLQLTDPVHAVLLDPEAEGRIVNDDVADAGCPDPATIDYGGYTAADCAVPQNAVTVTSQAELDAYMTDFGLDGTKVRNVKADFNPGGEVVIVSPCEVKLNGEGNYLDLTADKVCVYGRKGVAVAVDQGNPDYGITASTIALVSEEGPALFSKGLTLTADEISVRGLKQAQIGLSNTVTVTGSVILESTGDLSSSDALIKQGTYLSAGEVLLSASRTSKLGEQTEIDVAGALTVRSTGSVSGSVAIVAQGAWVTAGTMELTSGNKASLGLNVAVEVSGNFHMNGDNTCSIAASATITADSTSGNCLD